MSANTNMLPTWPKYVGLSGQMPTLVDVVHSMLGKNS
jgi:hypothetical protein